MLTKQQYRCQLQCHQQYIITRVCVWGCGGGNFLVNAQKYNDFLTNTQQMAILLGVDGDFLAIKFSFIFHAVNTKQLLYP